MGTIGLMRITIVKTEFVNQTVIVKLEDLVGGVSLPVTKSSSFHPGVE